MPSQLTVRLFGPSNSPDRQTNARHRALLRKGLELFTPEVLQTVFMKTNRLRLDMGSGMNTNQFGTIRTNFVDFSTNRLVTRETETPDPASRQALAAYRAAYDEYYKKQGHDFVIRNPGALRVLQAAEQAWHDYIVPYRAARRMGVRPEWALQPLPGLQRVRVDVVSARAPDARRPQLAFPTPPPTSPAAHGTPIGPRLPALVPVGSRLLPVDLTKTHKRKRELVIDISGSEDERPRKKPKTRKSLGVVVDLTKEINFLGVIDLTK
ncbi:hypothetical protein C8R44DRAFT_754943 [Mycena epipterygia]|nr:hypothetical protein C8R44DRAFT_754943 [Mycena epipterygia]